MVGGVKTKARTNPHLQEKLDLAWILEALASHTSSKSSLSTLVTVSQELQYYTNVHTTCTVISNNCKRERGRERGGQTVKSGTTYLGLAPTWQ